MTSVTNNVWKYLGAFVLLALLVFAYKHQSLYSFELVEQKDVKLQSNLQNVKKTPSNKGTKKSQRKPLKSKLKAIKRLNSSTIPTRLTTRPGQISYMNIKNKTSPKKMSNNKQNLRKQITLEDRQRLQLFIKSKQKKIILSYTDVFGDRKWWDVPRYQPLTEMDGSKCTFDHCQVVYDQKKYISNADAVLFHAADLPAAEHLKKIRKLSSKPSQVWIWMTSLSPLHYDHQLSFKPYESIFNWTGTYRRDSEIYTPFRFVQPLLPSEKRPNRKKNYAEGKDRMIIALISNNCDSYRIKFIRSLKQYINIDLYGSCKDKVNPELKEDCPFNSKECIKLQSRYKFTLSLENAYCKDYVTEKFYLNGLTRGNVPIVLNRANMSNMEVAPPGSYINVLDFKNLKVLADYLKKLAQNDKAYNQFHEWRQKYKLASKNRMCTACEALWKRDVLQIEDQKVQAVGKVWAFNRNCLPFTQNIFAKYLN